jgi:hypothetical protein
MAGNTWALAADNAERAANRHRKQTKLVLFPAAHLPNILLQDQTQDRSVLNNKIAIVRKCQKIQFASSAAKISPKLPSSLAANSSNISVEMLCNAVCRGGVSHWRLC